MNKYWYIIFNQKSTFYSYFPSFNLMSFFSVPEPHPRNHFTFCSHVSLSSSWLWQFLKIFLIFYDLPICRNIGQVFCRMSLNWDLSKVFLMIILGLQMWGRKPTELKCHSHQIIPKCMLWTRPVTVDINLYHLAKVVFVKVPYYKVTLSLPPILCCTLWKEVTINNTP